MLEHGCEAGMSIVVVHDVYCFKFVDVGGGMWVPDDAGIF